MCAWLCPPCFSFLPCRVTWGLLFVPHQKSLSGRGCDVPLLLGPVLLMVQLPFRGAGIDASGIQQTWDGCIQGRGVSPALLGVLKSLGAPVCPALGRGAVLCWAVPPIGADPKAPSLVPVSPVTLPQRPLLSPRWAEGAGTALGSLPAAGFGCTKPSPGEAGEAHKDLLGSSCPWLWELPSV